MFTGLVADLGTVAAVDAADDGVRLRVTTALAGELSDGDSLAVNGVCLTAVSPDAEGFGAKMMHETLQRSSSTGFGVGTTPVGNPTTTVIPPNGSSPRCANVAWRRLCRCSRSEG